jgi:hypothetical protein
LLVADVLNAALLASNTSPGCASRKIVKPAGNMPASLVKGQLKHLLDGLPQLQSGIERTAARRAEELAYPKPGMGSLPVTVDPCRGD